jgi:uncharacterized protein
VKTGAILQQIAHRPWPMPDAPWVMRQTWLDLLFAHWPVDAARLRAAVPRQFELDLFNGTAWLGIVPFRMTNVAPRGMPALPWLSAFPELNVRTYVRAGERPGVYFFSLDAGRALAVHIARTLFNLPYYPAAMTVVPRGEGIEYRSRRTGGYPAAELFASYGPAGPVFEPQRGSLEYFLTERYCLYNLDRRGAPRRLEIHHSPWPLQRAEGAFARNTMAEAAGILLPDTPPLLHFARRQDMVAWTPARIEE